MIASLITHTIAFVLGAVTYALVVRKNPSVQAKANELADDAKARIDEAKK